MLALWKRGLYCFWRYENGAIAVALVEDEATVKRFYKENGHYRLQPENSSMEPIIVDRCKILGRVIAVVRTLS